MNLIYLLSPVVILTLMIPGTARPDLEQLPTSTEAGQFKQVDGAYNCGILLLNAAGKIGDKVLELPKLYAQASVNKDQEFLTYVMAIIYVESRFNKQAISEQEARGLMQMTGVAVLDSVKHCKLKHLQPAHLFDSYTNVKYGTCYLNKLLSETDGDWTRALIAYNGGYQQLIKYDKGESIAGETSNYVLQVNRAKQLCAKSQGETDASTK